MTAWQLSRADERIEIVGELRMSDARTIWRTLHELAAEPGPTLDLDLERTTAIDGAVTALLVEVRNSLVRSGTRSEIVRASPAIQTLVHLYRGDEPPPALPPSIGRPGAIVRIGAAVEDIVRHARVPVSFTGELVSAVAQIVRKTPRGNWRAVPSLLVRAGADGVPIVVVLEFLVGFVIAFQAMRQLELFGANIYVADLVGISVTRELGPLMAAIIVTGRSGASFAAELGTMRVNEEIDALRTMGFSPIQHLVLPRLLALAIAAPILTLLGDVAAIVGGLVVGVTSLELTASGYLHELRTALVPSDVWTGLIKSVAFGIMIAIIGCHEGLATRGAAAGVGRGATTTVVHCLFTVVVLDTLFTVLFRRLGV